MAFLRPLICTWRRLSDNKWYPSLLTLKVPSKKQSSSVPVRHNSVLAEYWFVILEIFCMKKLSIFHLNFCLFRRKESSFTIRFQHLIHLPLPIAPLCARLSHVCALRMSVSRWLWDMQELSKSHQGGYERALCLLLTMFEKCVFTQVFGEKK